MRAVRLALPILTLAAACRSTDPTSAQPNLGPRVSVVHAESLTVQQVVTMWSQIPTRTRQVINDQAAWSAAWDQFTGFLTPKPPLPAVDFASQAVILVATGARNTGGYGIGVDSVVAFESGQKAYVTTTSPGRNCVLSMAITYPAQLVVVPRQLDAVTFVERESTHTCP